MQVKEQIGLPGHRDVKNPQFHQESFLEIEFVEHYEACRHKYDQLPVKSFRAEFFFHLLGLMAPMNAIE